MLCNSNILENFKNYSDLIVQQAIDGYSVLPHTIQSIVSIRRIIYDILNNKISYPLLSKETLIVLAFDGINFNIANSVWKTCSLFPLTSTFPSISSSAWLSSLTGMQVNEHYIPGVIFKKIENLELMNVYTEHNITYNDNFLSTNIFSDAIALGFEPYVISGFLSNIRCFWKDQLVKNSEVIECKCDWNNIKFCTNKIYECTIRELTQLLLKNKNKKRLLIWCFINTDDYIHKYGYDKAIEICLQQFENAALRLVRKGYNVIGYSDHGMVANYSSKKLIAQLDSLNSEHCENIIGGAGRVRWFYPIRGQENILKQKLLAMFKDEAYILSQADLHKKFILLMNSTISKQIGKIILIAKSHNFPSVDFENKFNHGALSIDEMLIPLAIWS